MRSRLLENLLQLAREQAQSVENALWEKLSRGELTPEERRGLAERARRDPDVAQHCEAYAPMGLRRRAIIVSHVLSIVRQRRVDDEWVQDTEVTAKLQWTVTLSASGSPPPRVEAPTLWVDRYRVHSVIGSGGAAQVFRAYDVRLAMWVAIKAVPMAMGGSGVVARFAEEARALAQMQSEHVVKVFDFGSTESTAYLVMELLEGCSLQTWMGQKGPLPIPEAIDAVRQACEGIAEAHALGIVHRDIKPSNLFRTTIGDRCCIKVLDFGVSNAVRSLAGPSMVGTVLYKAPEQIKEPGSEDPRADIWAIGVTLLELITGRPPFGGAGTAQIFSKILSGSRPNLPEAAPDLPEALRAVILKCLEPDRERRYASIREFADALEPFG